MVLRCTVVLRCAVVLRCTVISAAYDDRGVSAVADWLDSLGQHPWALWAAVAVVCGLVEVVTLDLVFLMLAGGALMGVLSALLGFGLEWQVVLAVAQAVVLVVTVRPWLVQRMVVPEVTPTGVAALVHRAAVVTAEVGPATGLIALAGESWTARTRGDERLAPGTRVVVVAIEGATAVVRAEERP